MANSTEHAMRTFKANMRELHGPRFGLKITESRATITYDGEPFVVVMNRAKGLPRGFPERTLNHILDLLTGKRTALWDEQAVFGEYPRSAGETRRRGERQADHDAKGREA